MERKDKNMYVVPDSYMGELKGRLKAIPQAEKQENRLQFIWPMAGLVASFGLLFLCGKLVSTITEEEFPPSDSDYYEYAYSMIPKTDPYAIYEGSTEGEQYSDDYTSEDIINYLIETGISINALANN